MKYHPDSKPFTNLLKMDPKKSKTLILTEKPSVARDFAKALGVKGKKDGYLENEHYIITWALGHLVELFQPQDYDIKWKKWHLKDLPILPARFQYKPIQKTRKQLKIISNLLSKKTTGQVVIATDAGRCMVNNKKKSRFGRRTRG